MRFPLYGVVAVAVILSMGFIAVLGYLITPDNSAFANRMEVSQATKQPGFKSQYVHLKKDKPTVGVSWWKGMLFGYPVESVEIPVETLKKHNDSLTFVDATSGVEFTKHISELQSLDGSYTEHRIYRLGTDRYGRDLLSRLIIATRVSFVIGFIAVGISLLIGLPLGLCAGYFGGWVDKVVMWLVNVVWSIPGLLLVIALTLALGKGIFQVFIAIGLTMWVEVARVVRGQVRSLRERAYVEVAQMMGFSSWRIMFQQILPGVLHPVIVISAANFATAILLESGLSFLGYGAQPPLPTWGGMVKDHWPYLLMGKPHLVLWPGGCILILVLAFMMFGNALRDLTDPLKNEQ
ncbi:MAG: ABC transporter permease [Cryomorphaceae bacterium]|nr:ABC transporter permease [Cryomorphaceae bacterium]